jgi:hypothetical protein
MYTKTESVVWYWMAFHGVPSSLNDISGRFLIKVNDNALFTAVTEVIFEHSYTVNYHNYVCWSIENKNHSCIQKLRV